MDLAPDSINNNLITGISNRGISMSKMVKMTEFWGTETPNNYAKTNAAELEQKKDQINLTNEQQIATKITTNGTVPKKHRARFEYTNNLNEDQFYNKKYRHRETDFNVIFYYILYLNTKLAFWDYILLKY